MLPLRSGRLGLEWVGVFSRNHWPPSFGTGGRNQSEWVAAFNRNAWPDSIGIAGRHRSEYAPGAQATIESPAIEPMKLRQLVVRFSQTHDVPTSLERLVRHLYRVVQDVCQNTG